MAASANLDLRGVRCPVNWARAKARLETFQRGDVLELLVDDPRALHDIPRAAEMEGYCVLQAQDLGEHVRIIIER